MIEYAMGLVLWDHGDGDGAGYFKKMLNSLQASDASYPSNPQHIARALKIVSEPGAKLGTLDQTKPYNLGERTLLRTGYVASDGSIPLFASPDHSSKQIGTLSQSMTASRLLRSAERDLLQGGNQIGWADRLTVSGAK